MPLPDGRRGLPTPARRGVPELSWRTTRKLAAVSFQGAKEPGDRSPASASEKRCWPLAASNIRSRQRRSMPSLVICTPSTGCSMSSSSEYSFDPLNMVSSTADNAKLDGGRSRRPKDLQFLLSIRIVADVLLQWLTATSTRSAGASSRLVLRAAAVAHIDAMLPVAPRLWLDRAAAWG